MIRYRIKKPLLIVVSILTLILFAFFIYNCASSDKYYFGKNSVFKSIEAEGLIDVINYTITTNENNITIEAAFCDQINTYVKLTVSGNAFDRNGEDSLDSHIEYAKLVDADGNSWKYEDVSTVQNGNFNSGETVLAFTGGPCKDSTVNLQIKFDNIDEMVVFDNIKIRVAQVVVRDVKKNNYLISVPYANGKISKIIYTPLKTQFVVDWEYENVDDFCDSYISFAGNHIMRAYTENDKYDFMIFPHNDTGKPEMEGKYNIYYKINPYDELNIDLFVLNEEKFSWDFSEHLLKIKPISD